MVNGETWLVDIRKIHYHYPNWHRNRVVKIIEIDHNRQLYRLRITLASKLLWIFDRYTYDTIGVENINFIRKLK